MHKPNKIVVNIFCIIGVALVLGISLLGPEKLASYLDRNMLNQIKQEPLEDMAEGYHYALSANEKLFILSSCLNNMILPETELSEKTNTNSADLYEELKGNFALVTNHQGTTEKKISSSEVVERVNAELEVLKELGVIPDSVREISSDSYSFQVYSAIDLREPGNSLSVWKVSLVTSHVNADKTKRVLDIYMDAESGKIYEFYVRVDVGWEQLKPEEIIKKWSEYLGLQGVEVYENDNPLLETTPYYLKYQVPGIPENKTVITIGFYEGINELFLKISK